MTTNSSQNIRGRLAEPLREPLREQSHSRNRAARRASDQERRNESIPRRNDLLPALTILNRPVAELVPHVRRLRKFSLEDIIEAANVISAKGFLQPIFISRDGRTILDGELRFEAARWLQLEEVPCIFTETLEPKEERAVRIALNRLGQRREWDLGELRLELEELLLDEEPIDLLGFDNIELDQIMDAGSSPEEDEVPVRDEGDPLTQPGDLWQLGDHKLICGDSRDPFVLEVLLGREQVQQLLTDPPYNIAISSIVSTSHREFAHASGEMSDAQFADFIAQFLSAARDVMVDGAIAQVFMDWRQIEILLRVGRETGLELINLVAWVKANGGMGSFYRSQHELVAVMKKPGTHKNRIQFGKKGRNRANVWFAPGAGTLGSDAREMLKEHPTSKPVQLLADAMIDVTDPGDIVLDCFGGSGSTLMAAERTARTARLIELDQTYCDVILRRWMAAKGNEPILVATGQTWSEVASERQDQVDEGVEGGESRESDVE